MTKRIVSGVFLLIALGALGLILAGALTSGEQLIVRFLTAIIVAALGLYVISDLRLQADDHAAATTTRTNSAARLVANSDSPPPDSTAAYMETVTGKRSAQAVDPASLEPVAAGDRELATASVNGQAKGEPTLKLSLERPPADQAPKPEPAAISTGPILETTPPPPEDKTLATEGPTDLQDATTTVTSTWTPPVGADGAESPYQADLDAAEHWPFNTTTQDPATTTESAEEEVDGLAAIFARETEQELAKHESPEAGSQAEGETGADSIDETPPEVTKETTSGAALVDGVGDFLNRGPELVNSEVESAATQDDASVHSDQHDSDPSTEPAPSDHRPRVSYVPPTTLPPTTLPPAKAAASEPEKNDSIAPIIDLRTSHSAVQAAAASGGGPSVNSVEELEAAIRSGELEVVSSLIEQHLLSTEGPITDHDVSTMVYVAFTSSELRKILLAGGTLDSDLSELELGDVEVFVDPTDEEIEALQESAAMINLRAADLITADSQAL